MANHPPLELIRERKLADLVSVPSGVVLEASGVIVKGRDYFVVFDNMRSVARIGHGLRPGSDRHAWVGRPRQGEGYEDVAHSARLRRFYLLIEARKHPDGSYKAVIEEYDDGWRLKARCWVDVPFQTKNRGFEGLAVVAGRVGEHLLALCEGNSGLAGRKGRTPGGGRMHVLEKSGRTWRSVAIVALPPELDFEDYSAVAVRGRTLAIVSQTSGRLWVGTLRRSDWTIVDDGRTYELPRTEKGRRLYCTIEGVDWLAPRTLVMVSDLRKAGYPDRCARTDQSIHVFRLPARRARGTAGGTGRRP